LEELMKTWWKRAVVVCVLVASGLVVAAPAQAVGPCVRKGTGTYFCDDVGGGGWFSVGARCRNATATEFWTAYGPAVWAPGTASVSCRFGYIVSDWPNIY
jgi:hypothetical protein